MRMDFCFTQKYCRIHKVLVWWTIFKNMSQYGYQWVFTKRSEPKPRNNVSTFLLALCRDIAERGSRHSQNRSWNSFKSMKPKKNRFLWGYYPDPCRSLCACRFSIVSKLLELWPILMMIRTFLCSASAFAMCILLQQKCFTAMHNKSARVSIVAWLLWSAASWNTTCHDTCNSLLWARKHKNKCPNNVHTKIHLQMTIPVELRPILKALRIFIFFMWKVNKTRRFSGWWSTVFSQNSNFKY